MKKHLGKRRDGLVQLLGAPPPNADERDLAERATTKEVTQFLVVREQKRGFKRCIITKIHT